MKKFELFNIALTINYFVTATMNNTLRFLYQASGVLCLGIVLHGSIVIDGAINI